MKYDLLYEIAKRKFDGNTMRGPRREFVFAELERMNLKPKMDDHGNILVERGSQGSPRLFSSHLDVDVSRGKGYDTHLSRYQSIVYGDAFGGWVDNAVGVYLNMLIAQRDHSERKNIYVFTASEKGARKIVESLQKNRTEPEFCVAIDVNYPRPLVSDKELDGQMKAKEWNKKAAHELFDQFDRTHCYMEGFEKVGAGKMAKALVNRYGDRNIKVRSYLGFDEAAAYGKIAPSFSFGPVFYGKPDEPNQKVRKSAVDAAYGFLRFLTQN